MSAFRYRNDYPVKIDVVANDNYQRAKENAEKHQSWISHQPKNVQAGTSFFMAGMIGVCILTGALASNGVGVPVAVGVAIVGTLIIGAISCFIMFG